MAGYWFYLTGNFFFFNCGSVVVQTHEKYIWVLENKERKRKVWRGVCCCQTFAHELGCLLCRNSVKVYWFSSYSWHNQSPSQRQHFHCSTALQSYLHLITSQRGCHLSVLWHLNPIHVHPPPTYNKISLTFPQHTAVLPEWNVWVSAS